ncbi:MAG TPA: magnesium transporter [Dehalococcoidia bacterium]|nr:magnesium transporter [Dehalococcoidia bacterium]
MLDISTHDRESQLHQAIAAGQPDRVWASLQDASEKDLTECLTALDPAEVAQLDRLLGDERVAELVERLEPSDAAQILLRLSAADAADVLEEMAPDDATDVIEEFDLAEAQAIFFEMDAEEAAELRELLGYPHDSAAGVMTPAFVGVAPGLHAEDAIQAIRQLAQVAETIYYVYVTDPEQRLLGVLSLRDLVLARPETPVRDLMNTQVATVQATADREEAAYVLTERGLLALPVVDAAGRILGIITADDVAEILERETTEDIEKLGGSQPLDVPYLRASVLLIARKRIGWLLILFVGASYTGTVMRHFQDTLDTVITLGLFIPLLIGTGGNVGSQITTTLIRALAVGEVELRDVVRVLRKELSVAALIAGVMAITAFVRAWTLGVGWDVVQVVTLTAVCIVLWAATISALVPLLLRRIGLDPAVVSSPMITTIVDGTGLFIYFTVANWILGF